MGARCPWVRNGTGAVATQNVTLPSHGSRVLELLGQGAEPAAAVEAAVLSAGAPDNYGVVVVDV